MTPLKLNPIYKNYIWGGNRLKTEYNKITDITPLAESWELACHKDGDSIIANGEFAGQPLREYLKTDNFPILIKLIDAKENLSVQVHPNDEYAYKHEGEPGKTEMWYIVDCEEDAYLYYGLKYEVTKDEFETHIKNGTVEEILNSVKVKRGDVFFIPAGTLHAIGKGIIIAEIQENSNTTYRVFDYGRGRQLHIDKAIDVTDLKPASARHSYAAESYDGYTCVLLSSCEYFTSHRLDIKSKASLSADEDSFHHLLVLSGDFNIDGISARKGDSIFIPSGYGNYVIEGCGEVIVTTV
ncbi:MAG: class I mannose-6-phosphate isomerase [Bacillota bacterium]|nr:class I mannose-6-phosphate isomerase [Bacillota bacterium]